MSRKVMDFFAKQAKRDGYNARSAFKLLQIQERYSVIRPGGTVLDLGCYPGAWLQVASRLTTAEIVGVDLEVCPIPKGCQPQRTNLIVNDVTSMTPGDFRLKAFNTVLSDMCHKTTGNAFIDAAKSLNLAQSAANLSLGACEYSSQHNKALNQPLLQINGNFVAKVLEGGGLKDFTTFLKPHFRGLHLLRPKATRSESREIYIIGLQRRDSVLRKEGKETP